MYGRVKRELPSGHTNAQVLEMSLNQWSLEFKPKNFPQLHSWEILRHEDKFNPEQETAEQIVGDPVKLTEIADAAKSGRPVGKKRSLKEAQASDARIQLVNEFRNFANVLKARDQTLRESAEMAMFSSCQDDLSKRYFDLRRRRVLERLEHEERQRLTVNSSDCKCLSLLDFIQVIRCLTILGVAFAGNTPPLSEQPNNVTTHIEEAQEPPPKSPVDQDAVDDEVMQNFWGYQERLDNPAAY